MKLESGAIVGNLDCEADFAAASGFPRPPMSRAAIGVASSAATLLRAFARSDRDRLVLPARVGAERLAVLPGLPRPCIVRRQRDSSCGGPRLHWAAVAGDDRRAAAETVGGDADEPVHRAAWRWPSPRFDAAVRANDRRFATRLAHDLDCALPGTAVAEDVAGVRRAVCAIAGPWVAKAPFSAAGRWRVRGEGPDLQASEAALRRLLGRQGAVVVEPWCSRTADFGVAALASPDGIRLLGAHRQVVDTDGRFLGLEILARFAGMAALPWISQAEAATLEATVSAVGEALIGIGFHGPFGVDAWRFEDVAGRLRLQPLGEINARMTFGLVARALVDRLRSPLGLGDDEAVTLRFGRGTVPPASVALLHPSSDGIDGRTSAWLERSGV